MGAGGSSRSQPRDDIRIIITDLIRGIELHQIEEVRRITSIHGKRLLLKKLNRKGERALQLAARNSVQSGATSMLLEIGNLLLLLSREAQSKGEHIDQNLARSLGRALFGEPERYSRMSPEEIAVDGVAYAANKSNHSGQTALMTACEVGSADGAMALLNMGADPWKGDGIVGRTCIHYAAGRGHSDAVRMIVGFIQSLTTEQLLAKYHVEHVPRSYLLAGNVHDIPSASGLTPLAYAAWHGQRRCVEVLCELGASLYTTSWMRGIDPECRECLDGSTPLHLASLRGSLRTIKCLLRCYVRQVEERDLLAQDPERPPLSPLSQHPFVRAQQIQQRELPDIRLTIDSHGFTPRAIAVCRGHHPSILRALDPSTPIGTVLAEDEAQERALGPPRLIEIVSKYYRGILQARIQEIRQGPAEAKDAPLSNLENSIRGGMAFLSLISRTSSITNAQSLQARPSKELSSNKVSIVSQAPIGVSGCSDDEGEGKGGHGDLEGAAGDVAGPLPILIANRPLPSNHTRTHSSARGPSGDGGEFNTVQEERNSCSLFFSASQVPLGPEEASWALHPLGGTGVRFSNLSQASPLKRGSITVEGLLNSPSLDVRNNPIYRQSLPTQELSFERGSTAAAAQGGDTSYHPPSLHHAASAAMASTLAAARSENPDEQQALQAAAEMAASSEPEAIAAAAARFKRMTDGDRSNRESMLGDGHACCVCLDEESGDKPCIFLNIVSCNHTICVDCAQELLKHSEYKPALCPICRGYMKSFERLKSKRPGRGGRNPTRQ